MSEPPVRSTPPTGAAPGRVVVVSAASAVGAAVVRALSAAPDVQEVVAVHDAGARGAGDDAARELPPADPALDRPATPPRGAGAPVRVQVVDVASPHVLRALEGADAVVHVALDTDLAAALLVDPDERRARALAAAQAVTTAAAAVGARHLVVVSSAAVHGTAPAPGEPLADDAPLLAVPDEGLVGDLLAVEEVAQRARSAHPGLAVAVLRPTAVVGPGVDTVTTRHFAAPRLLTLRERPPAWQLTSLDDLAAAVVVVLRAGLAGPLGVGGDGVLDQEAVEAVTGMRRVELSARQARATAERLVRRGVHMTPTTDLAHVVHPQTVSAAGLRAAGWRPRTSTAQSLALLVELLREPAGARPPGTGGAGAGDGRAAAGPAPAPSARRGPALGGVATAGAAGAAVALVATAALVRQARARRGRGRG